LESTGSTYCIGIISVVFLLMKWVRDALSLGKTISLSSELGAGLGKTVQVISFLAHLKEKGNKGPHLVVVPYVPMSTLALRSLFRTLKLIQFINLGKLVPRVCSFCTVNFDSNLLCRKR
jgi:hypothetical protein